MTKALGRLIETFRKWQLMPDLGPLLLPLAAYAAHRLPGDPVWLLLVGPASSGKTEKAAPLGALADVYPVSTLTEASLLSGTSSEKRPADATGGLLMEIGKRGVILCKDFGSVLSMHRDARAALLAALREIYDGSWTRALGTDGGKTLSWSGSIGLIAACTPAIDRHNTVMSSMGERFVIYRMPELPTDEVIAKAIEGAGDEARMRRELQEAVCEFVRGLEFPGEPPPLEDGDRERLTALATHVAIGRAPVIRDGHRREIEVVPGAEVPARVAKSLRRLLDGLRVIGTDAITCWSLLMDVAQDCLPKTRRAVLDELGSDAVLSTARIAAAIGLPIGTTRRVLEDLLAYKVIHRQLGGSQKEDLWRQTEATRQLREAAGFTTIALPQGDSPGDGRHSTGRESSDAPQVAASGAGESSVDEAQTFAAAVAVGGGDA